MRSRRRERLNDHGLAAACIVERRGRDVVPPDRAPRVFLRTGLEPLAAALKADVVGAIGRKRRNRAQSCSLMLTNKQVEVSMRWFASFVAGLLVGMWFVTGTAAQRSGGPPAGSSVAQLRLYTIDKGKLDDFATQWRAGVYPLRTKLGYRIPFAAKIPETNQFVWLLTYDGPESWDKKEDEYYASAARTSLKPDPAQLIARPERWFVTPLVGWGAKNP